MFKERFKYYKSRKPPPSFNEVLDIHKIKVSSNQVQRISIGKEKFANTLLQNPFTWEVYSIPAQPGLIYIKNPFTILGQQYYIRESLENYTKKPHKLNIDLHDPIPENYDFWQYANDGHTNYIKKLRWSTLGYHHNWDTKVYNNNNKSELPTSLVTLCKDIAGVLDYKDFEPEAAIVNFYHMDSTLAPHTDHSEQYLEAPLFSFSFGNSAIFLIGGQTLDEKPTALFLHSGDIVIMSKESRLSYHAVPRIIKTENQSWLHDNCNVNNDFIYFNNYLSCARININVRQVKQN